MLREAHSANDDARLDDIGSVPDDARLGAELEGAPPEVRAAAVRRSRRIPEPSIMIAAWSSLPPSVRDQIGVAALTHSFYSHIGGLDPQALTLEAGRRCERIDCAALHAVDQLALAVLPSLYGTDTEEPLWALSDTHCQTALNIDPVSASNFDPLDAYDGTPLISPAKRVGVAEPG